MGHFVEGLSGRICVGKLAVRVTRRAAAEVHPWGCPCGRHLWHKTRSKHLDRRRRKVAKRCERGVRFLCVWLVNNDIANNILGAPRSGRDNCVYIYIYIYIYIYTHITINIYIYIYRERERGCLWGDRPRGAPEADLRQHLPATSALRLSATGYYVKVVMVEVAIVELDQNQHQ